MNARKLVKLACLSFTFFIAAGVAHAQVVGGPPRAGQSNAGTGNTSNDQQLSQTNVPADVSSGRETTSNAANQVTTNESPGKHDKGTGLGQEGQKDIEERNCFVIEERILRGSNDIRKQLG